ncbi:MAG: Gfo/Idh/MocA family oxidoreductase [Bacillota bacterium]|jgi:Predicted dehydrogenases and related proteins|nr:gfo/Idh/MocA family oxidoreductase [Bacillota bacterium]
MNPIRVGVIGCGSIAKHRHLPEYAANPHAQIVAVCDVVRERAEAAASRYGAEAYTDWRAMLKRGDLDAVSVCTPNDLHGPITIAALEAGIHVLCEKPMATSAEEAEAMIRAAESSGKILMIAHNQRFMKAHVKAKQILSSGALGRVLTFRTTFGHAGPETWSVEGAGGWFFRKERAFLGALGDLGIHKVDLLRWLLDDEIVEVAALMGTLEKADTDVEDNAVCILRTRRGVIGTMVSSWTYKPYEDNSTVLYCERGTLRIGENPDYQVVVDYAGGERELHRVGKIQTNEEGGQTASGVIDAFLESIVKGTPPLVPGEEGYRSLKVILAAVKSAETKRVVAVE